MVNEKVKRRKGAGDDEPPCAPPCIHVLVYLVVDPIRLLVILLVHSPGEQADFVVRILVLFGINLRFFATLGLGVTGRETRRQWHDQSKTEGGCVRNNFFRGSFASRADIRPGCEAGCTEEI
jgi:hypothetical protein